MNEKISMRTIGIVIGVIAIMCFVSYFVGRTNNPDNRGTGSYTERERQLLDQLGEYERRETARVKRERARIEDTETKLTALRGLDRRSSSLYEAIRAECKILEDYFNNVRSEFSDNNSDMASN